MFDYVKFGVSDYVVSKVFFFKVFELLGVVIVGEGELLYGIEISVFGKFLLCLFQIDEKLVYFYIVFVVDMWQ